MVKETILHHLRELGKPMGLTDAHIQLDHPTEARFGDYTTNMAMIAAKLLKKSPMVIAEELKVRLTTLQIEGVQKTDIAAPGFLNFWISEEGLIKEVNSLLTLQKNVAISGRFANKKIMVEFTDPNPFKEFHIGHLYSNAVGESVSRLFETRGANVWRANFFGDVGMHVAKAIFGLRQKMKDEGLTINDLEKRPLKERVKYMGEAYAMGSAAYDKKDPQIEEEIKQLNLLIFIAAQQQWQETKGFTPKVDYRKYVKTIDEKQLLEIKELWVTGRQWSLEYFETIYARLGTKFNGYYPESLTGEWGYDFIMQGLQKGIFEKSDGAVVYRGDKVGLHTRVFINKLGLPTYEGKDIGNAPYKYSEFPYDISVVVTGNEINEYFKVVLAAMKEVNPELGAKTVHIGHGMVRLPEGKMSSRTGNVKTGEWLLDEAKQRVRSVFSDMDEETLEIVAVGAVKYALLKIGVGKDVVFNFDESVSLEGNSGPYLQYTYVRTQSVLSKAGIEKNSHPELLSGSYEMPDQVRHDNLEVEEMILLRTLYVYHEMVDMAGLRLSPSILANYLFNLAQIYNLFYQKHHILTSDKREFRVGLTGAVGKVLGHGLYLLGIKVPSKM